MSVYKLKTGEVKNLRKVISLLRGFDRSLSIADIRERIAAGAYDIEYDLHHWDITEEIAGKDRIEILKDLIQALEDSGAGVSICEDDVRIGRACFENRMRSLEEMKREVEEDTDREAES